MSYIPLHIEEIARVPQEVVDPGRGDCMQACVASLLRLPSASVVPAFHPPEHEGYNWLSLHRLWFDYVHRQDDGTYCFGDGRPAALPLPGYWIASVPSARFAGATHAVIVKDGDVVWDPSPFASERALPYEPVGNYYRIVYTGAA